MIVYTSRKPCGPARFSESLMRVCLSLKGAALAAVLGFAATGATAQTQPAPDTQPDTQQTTPANDADGGAASAPQSRTETVAGDILGRAIDFLAAQDNIRVDWFVSYDVVLDGREKITKLRSGTNLLSRGKGFYSYAENGLETREYYFNGEVFSVVDIEGNAYTEAPAQGSFEDLVGVLRDEYDLILPIWQVLGSNNREVLLEDAESSAYLGLTRIAGRTAHHLAFSDYDSDWQVWVSADSGRPEILMLVGTDPYEQGWPQFRAYFTGWDFAPEVPEGAFTYVPDETAERMVWPRPGSYQRGGE